MRTRFIAVAVALTLVAALQTLAGAATTSVQAADTAQAAPACGRNTPLDGLVGGATPVILVHGWTGSPMSATRAGLEGRTRQGRQYLLFDYSSAATAWADDPRISACLATYIHEVSERHRRRGGDGRVYLVAHSMGGLAIRFALDERYGHHAGLSSRVGGVVTLDTPFRGSMWGDSLPAGALSALHTGLGLGFPLQDARAWHCLAGGPSKRLPRDCAAAPALDPEVPLAQVAGDVTVRRTLFGLTAYEIDLASDGIVDTDSQHGSRDAAGRAGPNQADKPVVSCRVDSGDLGTDLPRAMWSMFSDNTLIDIYSGDVPPEIGLATALDTLGRLMVFAGCSHINIPQDGAALDVVDEALDRLISRGRELTDPSQLRRLKVPASCGHPAEVIPGTKKDYGSYGGFATVLVEDAVFGDLTGDGRSDAVVPLLCSAGGVSWPEHLLVYGPGVRLLGSVEVGDAANPQEHADVSELRFDGDTVDVAFTTYEGAGFNVANYRGDLTWTGSRPVLDHGGGPLTVTYTGDSSGLGIGSGVVTEPDAADLWLRPAPADFRAFVQRLWQENDDGPTCPATVSVDRWSHLGFAAGGISTCGGYGAVWARGPGGWEEVLGYQDGPYCDALSDRARDALTALAIPCLDPNDVSEGELLGEEWPASGE